VLLLTRGDAGWRLQRQSETNLEKEICLRMPLEEKEISLCLGSASRERGRIWNSDGEKPLGWEWIHYFVKEKIKGARKPGTMKVN
jgi:hypothetical protein